MAFKGNKPKYPLGELIRQSRNHLGKSQQDISDLTGISVPTISRYETQLDTIRSLRVAELFSKHLDIPLGQIMTYVKNYGK